MKLDIIILGVSLLIVKPWICQKSGITSTLFAFSDILNLILLEPVTLFEYNGPDIKSSWYRRSTGYKIPLDQAALHVSHPDELPMTRIE